MKLFFIVLGLYQIIRAGLFLNGDIVLSNNSLAVNIGGLGVMFILFALSMSKRR